jgi:hypothetical protein
MKHISYTGLQETEHQKAVRDGRDYVVFEVDPNENGERIYAIPENNIDNTKEFLDAININSWVRVRAVSQEEAIKNFNNAMLEHNEYQL